jgi:hypothetical protein
MMFAAVVGHCCGRATPFLRNAPQRQSMEIVRGETIYRNRNAVQTNPATSVASCCSLSSHLRSPPVPSAACNAARCFWRARIVTPALAAQMPLCGVEPAATTPSSTRHR